MELHPQDLAHAQSLADPTAFWGRQAEQLCWHKKPSTVLETTTALLQNGAQHPKWSWFPNGEISTCFNCVDRHVLNGYGESIAVIWDSPVSQSKQSFTYRQLLEEVEVLAGVLRNEGVGMGDVVLIYS